MIKPEDSLGADNFAILIRTVLWKPMFDGIIALFINFLHRFTTGVDSPYKVAHFGLKQSSQLQVFVDRSMLVYFNL